MNSEKYLGVLDKIFFICCTTSQRRIALTQYAVNRLFGSYAEIRYTSTCKLQGINQNYIRDHQKRFKDLIDSSLYAITNCSLEHYKCIKQAYERGFEKIMICEDDFRVEYNHEEDFKLAIQNIPEDGNIIKLHTWLVWDEGEITISDETNSDLISYNDYYYKINSIDNNEYYSSLCIIYDRKGMEFMMNSYEQNFRSSDVYFASSYAPFKDAINNHELNVYHIKDNDLLLCPNVESLLGYVKKT